LEHRVVGSEEHRSWPMSSSQSGFQSFLPRVSQSSTSANVDGIGRFRCSLVPNMWLPQGLRNRNLLCIVYYSDLFFVSKRCPQQPLSLGE
jgi:hypothetical protein